METISTREMTVRTGDRGVFCFVRSPLEDGKHPAVILSHGYNGCHADFERESLFFASHGVIACSLDFCGGSVRSKSTGRSEDMTLFTEKEDLLAVFDAVSRWERVDPSRVFLLGGSQGGLVTALAAEELGDRARGMILYFPALNIPDDWRHRFDETGIPETFPFWGLTLGKRFFESMKDLDPFEVIGGFKNPVLILQGDRDVTVRPAVADRAVRKYAHGEMILLPGEAHGFTSAGTEFAMEKALDLMEKCGGGDPERMNRIPFEEQK